MDNDLISRSGAVGILRAKADMAVCTDGQIVYENAARIIEKLPAVDAAPVRRGEWTEPYKGEIWDCYACSLCGHTCESKSRFCPECGAKMDAGTHNA